ncbi:helix-turn-helix domain-containing protein [Actinomadura welshii]|uniref:helix-turn-helix domain-containing protein n=1 Tax=Actinomadura welshii TaxID=3103817 RepID=UPI00046415D8|nr:helix-turn-helix domain-containing protein [Actinomadura madurae]
MTREELAALPTTTTIETAARALGLGRTRAYELARQGRFPCKVIRIGTSYRVVTADLRDLLAGHGRGGEDAR